MNRHDTTQKRSHQKNVVSPENILKYLSINGEIWQGDLKNVFECEERTILRKLKLLRESGMIYVSRTEPSSKLGKDKNFLTISFFGLIYCIVWWGEDIGYLQNLIKINRKKWIIFDQWDQLNLDLSTLPGSIRYHFFSDRLQEPKKTFKEFRLNFQEYMGNEFRATERVLQKDSKIKEELERFLTGADSLFKESNWVYIDGKWITQIDENLEFNIERVEKVFSNEKLKHIINRQIELEEKRCKRLDILKNLLSIHP